MLGRVVDHVAALTERGEVARRIVCRIVVEVRARDVDPRQPHHRRDVGHGCAYPSPAAIAPEAAIGVPPSSVAEVEHPSAMRTPAMLALAFRAPEPDQP